MAEIISCIYIIKSKIKPDRFYVGSAVNFYARKRQHISDLKLKKHTNKRISGHVIKYTIEDLTFEILEVVFDKNNLIEREQYHIDTLKPSFNICKTAASMLGFKHSIKTREEDSKRKMGSCFALGHKKSEESKKAHSERMKNNKNMLGKKHSIESREKMRAAKIGKVSYYPNEEQKQKQRERYLGAKTNFATKVIDINSGKIYGCIKDAAAALNIKYSRLANGLCGQVKNNTSIRYYYGA